MRISHRLACGAAFLVGGLSACSKGPIAPTPTPEKAALERVEIVGPGALERYREGAYRVIPGEAAQFKAIARFKDGSVQDITSEAQWESSDWNVLSVAGAGLVTARQRGEAHITIRREGPPSMYGSQGVIVLPADSYIVAGEVFESYNPRVTLGDALLTVLNGPLAGEQVVTTSHSGYTLFGLSGPTTIRVQKAGYHTKDSTVVVSEHQRFDVDLQLIRPRPDLSGAYTLTLTAANECAPVYSEGTLPDDARQRRYSASVSQSGPLLSVRLSGAMFADPMPADRSFSGRIDPFSITFDMTWGEVFWDFGPPRIVEVLPSGEVLVISGSVQAAASRDGIAGTFIGAFYLYPEGVTPRFGLPRVTECYATNHQFVLSH